MSQRAAWQLERLGFSDVYDFVYGKAHWLASGRPTCGSVRPSRVGDVVSSMTTAELDQPVVQVRDERDGDSDVVVIDSAGIVYGRVRAADLDVAHESVSMADIMQVGPTTIRPDETVADVEARMEKRGVSALLVTKPTGELIGQFRPTKEKPNG